MAENKQSARKGTATTDANNLTNKKSSLKYFGNNSFSGCDMVAVMSIPGLEGVQSTYVLGSLQTISYSTSMNRTAIRNIGNVNAKDYLMGPRTIAGSLVFAVFDKHFAIEAIENIQGNYGKYYILADELPPFDITISLANEYGATSKLAIYGVRLVNEGQVMSVNDIYIENTYQFVAVDIDVLDTENSSGNSSIYIEPTYRQGYITDPVDITEVEAIESTDNEEEQLEPTDILDIKVIVETHDELDNKVNITPGYAVLDLNIIQTEGFINIYNNIGDSLYKLNLAKNKLPITQTLEPGIYKANYSNLNNETTDTIKFEINSIESNLLIPNKPLIMYQEKTSTEYLVGLKASDEITKGFAYCLSTDDINDHSIYTRIDITEKEHQLVLQQNMSYCIVAYNDNKFSEKLTLTTVSNIQPIFSDFKNYIDNNQHKIPTVYMIYFDDIWTKALAINSYSLIEALGKVKRGITDKDMLKACDYFILIASEYENDTIALYNQSNVVNAPIIIDEIMGVLEFDLSIKELYIEGGNIPLIVEQNSFIKKDNKYNYTINQSAGLYTVVAIDTNNRESVPIYVYIYSKEQKAEFNKNRKTFEDERYKDVSLTAINNQYNETIQKGSEDYEFYNAIYFDNELSKTNKTISPIIQTNKKDKIIFNLENVYVNNYVLCLDKTSDLNFNDVIARIPLTSNHKTYTFYADKYKLLKGINYSVWIEDTKGKVLSRTTTFTIGDNTSDLTIRNNKNTINVLKALYTEKENISYIMSLNFEDEYIDPFNIFNDVILNNFNLPINYPDRNNLIIDAVNAKNKYYYITNKPINTTLSVGISYLDKVYIMTSSTTYDNFICTFVYKDKIAFNSYDIQDYNMTCKDILGVIIQYRHIDSNIYTNPIIFDKITNSILLNGGMNVGVIK